MHPLRGVTVLALEHPIAANVHLGRIFAKL